MVTFDRSGEALEAFCRLNDLTRQRHGLPPQPTRFFRNVHKHILAKGLGIVALARHNGGTIAASVFFLFGPEALYKYGASDHAHQAIRPGNLLMWEAIRWLKANGSSHLDLGRTEPENEGLLRYKRAWGGVEGTFDYHRYSLRTGSYVKAPRRVRPSRLKRLIGSAPLPLLRVMGGLLYRHVG
jgi:CelD/BcsL family acetyltransferase involved in cellulose biosynthesis